MSDNWQQERQAAERLTQEILRQQSQGQEPVIRRQDLALLNVGRATERSGATRPGFTDDGGGVSAS